MGMMGAERNLVTIRGRVASIERGPEGGMRLMVESDSRLMPVLIGPGFGADVSDRLEPNARVQVTGMQVSRGGHTHVMAGKISFEEDGKMTTMRRMDKPPRMNKPPRNPHRQRTY